MEEVVIPNVPFNDTYRKRTKEASLRVIRLFQHLPRTGEANILGKQLLRSATSVAANFRAACRGRSAAEWYAKLCICVEEADETLFWLELIGDAGILPKDRLLGLEKEYTEILSVLATARKKAKPR
ncbi:four helix bundle protein [Hymenobacter sp. BT186]|uniref:Four helix bundle protein n=1 Tax=Hymenobacter telluris TaxID=2816474 RepID=A0A939EXA3_9BACT|nr:four helix bundle protein [Hymenobacter telluris]MBO0358325.1 four helix bundle protein [Hymenobacter telluris]MBW3374351.1 four helix bundle protein [Hymenobacter norwichensis]